MFRDNALKRRLAAGGKSFGVFLGLGSPAIAETMALAGHKVCLIDKEHGLGDLASAVNEIRAAQNGGATAVLRVSANDPVTIKLALDMGVEGIMIPAINDGAQARRAAAACRYPPRGIRGFGVSVVRAASYGVVDTRRYLKECERNLLVIGQIETRAGVENCEAICAVDGIDMIFVGPYDLSANLGHIDQPDHPETLKAIVRVERAAKKHGKWLGAIPTPSRSAAQLYADGYDLIIAQSDVVIQRSAGMACVAEMRKLVRAHGRAKTKRRRR